MTHPVVPMLLLVPPRAGAHMFAAHPSCSRATGLPALGPSSQAAVHPHVGILGEPPLAHSAPGQPLPFMLTPPLLGPEHQHLNQPGVPCLPKPEIKTEKAVTPTPSDMNQGTQEASRNWKRQRDFARFCSGVSKRNSPADILPLGLLTSRNVR